MADVVAKFKLEDGSELPIGKSFISSLKSVSESTSDAGSINYGTLANSGSIVIQDGNGYISKMIDDGLLPVSNLDVKVEVDGEVFQNHITTDSEYNTEDRTLNISLSNFIKNFDVLKYKGYPYPDESRTLYDLFYDVLYSYYYPQQPNEVYPDFIDGFFDEEVLDYIKNITILYPVIEYGKTYRQVLDELCTVAQLNIFSSKENLPRIETSRPIISEDEKINSLTWNNIVEDLKYTKTLKNKYDGVEIDSVIVKDETDFNAIISSWTTKKDEFTIISDKDEDTDSSTNLGITTYSRAYVSANFYQGAILVEKKSKMNLEQIKSIYSGVDKDGEPKIKYSVDYVHKQGGVTLYGSESSYTVVPNYDESKTETGVGPLANYSGFVAGDGNVKASVNDRTNLKDVKVQDAGDYFLVAFTVLGEYSTLYGKVSTNGSVNQGEAHEYTAKELTVTIYGEKRTITFEPQSANTSNIEDAKTIAKVNSNNLLQTTTKYGDRQVVEVIKENILSDYKNGMSDGQFTLNKPLFDNGNVLEYPSDSRIWKVIGNEFNYDGEYLFPVSVVECIPKRIQFGLLNDYGEVIYYWSQLIDNGLITVEGTTLTNVDDSLDGNISISPDIKRIGYGCFEGCNKIKRIIMQSGVTFIDSLAFSGCSSLTRISIPDTVTFIGNRCFRKCSSLSFVKLSNNLNFISEYMFIDCSELKTITLPSNLSSIQTGAFENSGLVKTTIPKLTSIISPRAFSGCSNLSSVVFEKEDGWIVASDDNLFGTKVNVSNPETNATNLKSVYVNSEWHNQNLY